MNKIWESLPNVAPEGPLETDKKGPLSVVGDPLGKGLEKGLAPVGHVTGKIGEPSGEALIDAQKQMKEEAGYSDKTKVDDKGPGGESIGGQKQSGQNPLGL